jgi:predicted Zn-dependent protease
MSRRSATSLLCLCPLLLTVGCAGLRLPDAPTEDIAEIRRARADEATQTFQTGRDFAQLQDAAARWSRGDAKGCEQELQRLLARSPQHHKARLFLADVCMADGRRQEALEQVRAVLDADPQNAHANRTLGLLRKTETADRSGHDGSSEQATQTQFLEATALPTNPNDPQNPISAATAALRNNEPARALELLATARRQSPNSAAVHRIFGVAHYRLGDYESSQVSLQQALSLDNSAAVTYFLLGCTQAKLGQLESADANFRKARAIDPTYSKRQ